MNWVRLLTAVIVLFVIFAMFAVIGSMIGVNIFRPKAGEIRLVGGLADCDSDGKYIILTLQSHSPQAIKGIIVGKQFFPMERLVNGTLDIKLRYNWDGKKKDIYVILPSGEKEYVGSTYLEADIKDKLEIFDYGWTEENKFTVTVYFSMTSPHYIRLWGISYPGVSPEIYVQDLGVSMTGFYAKDVTNYISNIYRISPGKAAEMMKRGKHFIYIIVDGILSYEYFQPVEDNLLRRWIENGGVLVWIGKTIGQYYRDRSGSVRELKILNPDRLIFGRPRTFTISGEIDPNAGMYKKLKLYGQRHSAIAEFYSLEDFKNVVLLSKYAPGSQATYAAVAGYIRMGKGRVFFAGIVKDDYRDFEEYARSDLLKMVLVGLNKPLDFQIVEWRPFGDAIKTGYGFELKVDPSQSLIMIVLEGYEKIIFKEIEVVKPTP